MPDTPLCFPQRCSARALAATEPIGDRFWLVNREIRPPTEALIRQPVRALVAAIWTGAAMFGLCKLIHYWLRGCRAPLAMRRPPPQRTEEGADISALRAETFIAKAVPQLEPQFRDDTGCADAGRDRRGGKPETGQRRHNDRKGVGPIAAMRRGVREERNNALHFDEGTGHEI